MEVIDTTIAVVEVVVFVYGEMMIHTEEVRRDGCRISQDNRDGGDSGGCCDNTGQDGHEVKMMLAEVLGIGKT